MTRIRVSQLVVLEAVQPRARGTCPRHVEELTEFLTSYPDRDTEPVIAYRDPVTEEFRLSEGFHRVAAYRRAGREFIPCVVREGDLTACRLNALASNAAHGRGRSTEDKQKVIRETLALVTEWADKRIADHLLVADKTVATARAEMVAAGLIPDLDYRIGGDGRRLTVKRPSLSEFPTKTHSESSDSYLAGESDPAVPGGLAGPGPSDWAGSSAVDQVDRPAPGLPSASNGRPHAHKGTTEGGRVAVDTRRGDDRIDRWHGPGAVSGKDLARRAAAGQPSLGGVGPTGAEGTPAPAAQPRDALGRPIPAHLQEVWTKGKRLTDGAKGVIALIRSLKGLEKDEAVGGFLGRRPLIRERLEDAAADLKLEAPYCVCPGCDGEGDSEQCPSCAGKGYCTGSEYHDLHPTFKETAASYARGDAWEGDDPPPPGTPRAYVPPAPGLDALGEPIPAKLRDVFADRSLTELADALMSASRRVKSDRQWNPHLPLYLIETLQTASHDVAGARPYAACRCRAKGCADCLTTGYRPARDKDELAAGR